MIQNLQELIQARDKQLGGNMLENKPGDKNSEMADILKLLFTYMKESFEKLNHDNKIIKAQQEEILNRLKDKE